MFLSLLGLALAGDIDTSKSSIQAVGAKVTGSHDITFDEWSGTLETNDDKLVGVSVTVQTASIRADHPKLTAHLQSPDFFDVEQFPTATFTSTALKKKKGENGATHMLSGDLTMHGVTKAIAVPATVDGASLTTTFVIDRTDFGIVYPGMPDDLIRDDVTLTVKLVGG